jgi:transcriptional antiterminator NusG
MTELPWHVVQAVANHEKCVAQHFAARSIEHYLPLYTERSKWTDRTVAVERPLFTGYVFVRLSPATRLAVISTPGVIRTLGDGPASTVSSEEVAKIREGLAEGYILTPHPCLSVGTRVCVREGIFRGSEGVVTELRHHCRVVISVFATQQCFSLEIPLDHLEVLKIVDVSSKLAKARAVSLQYERLLVR